MGKPGFMSEVKLFQILQRNLLLLLAPSMEQPLHTALKGKQKEPESSTDGSIEGLKSEVLVVLVVIITLIPAASL